MQRILIDSPSYDSESKDSKKKDKDKSKDTISLTEDNAEQIAAMLKAKM